MIKDEELFEMFLVIISLLTKYACPTFNILHTACAERCPYADLCGLAEGLEDYLVDKRIILPEDFH